MHTLLTLRSAVNPNGPPLCITVESPDVATNERGRVTISEAGRIDISITAPDEAMRAVGITCIKTVYPRIKQSPKGPACEVNTNKGEGFILLASRPWLVELLDNGAAITEAFEAAKTAAWETERADFDAKVKQPLLAKMAEQVAALRAQIPAECIEVEISQSGESDGYPVLTYMAENVDLSWSDVTIVGVADATIAGALSPFSVARVGYTTKAALGARYAAMAAKLVRDASAHYVLLHTPVPPEAVAAYNRYSGNSDTAWERSDESAWAAINRWTPFIEAQASAAASERASLSV